MRQKVECLLAWIAERKQIQYFKHNVIKTN